MSLQTSVSQSHTASIADRQSCIEWSDIVDRQTGLLTPAQNRALRDVRVLLLGVGGMGMNAAALLVRAGFERFTLVDCDEIDGTSVNRTPFSFDDTIGEAKVHATKRYMLKVNPAAEVEVLPPVRFGLDSDPDVLAALVRRHDVMSWAMDGIAGRMHYTRITHEIGRGCPSGKPAVESWAVPYHMCVWTIPNAKGTPTWEECFGLPTAGMDIARISERDVRQAQERLFAGFLRNLPGLSRAISSELMEQWLNLSISNRTLGPHVVGCGSLIAFEILKNALCVAGEPLDCAPIQAAPWMSLYDTRRNVAYEYNFRSKQFRWRHPLTGELLGPVPASALPAP